MRWSTSDRMDYSVCRKDLEGESVNVGEWYGVKRLTSIMGSVHLVRCNPAVRAFDRRLPWSHHQIYVDQL